MGYGELPRDIAGCDAIWLALHKEPEHFQPSFLGKGRERENCVSRFHLSRLSDIWKR